jgi:hypothetical protein
MLLRRLKHLYRNLLKYPWVRLVPLGYYKYIEIESLKSRYQYIVRRSLANKKDSFDKFGFIRQEALFNIDNEQDFFQLSVNLLGIFKEDDIKYRVISVIESNKHAIWRRGDYFAISKFDFTIFPITVPIYTRIEDVHNRTFPIERTKNNKLETIKCKLRLIHKPTFGNYWHFEFEVSDEEKPIKSSNATWKQNAVKKLIKQDLQFIFSQSPS